MSKSNYLRESVFQLLLFLAFMLPVSTWAQSTQLTGTVTDAAGESIIGASVFEKHFKLADDNTSVDAAFSATPAQLKEYVNAINDAWAALGEAKFGPASAAEAQSTQFRRSIYVVADVAEGEVFTTENIRCIRPGLGLHTKHFKSILGKTAARAIDYGTPLSLEMVSS